MTPRPVPPAPDPSARPRTSSASSSTWLPTNAMFLFRLPPPKNHAKNLQVTPSALRAQPSEARKGTAPRSRRGPGGARALRGKRCPRPQRRRARGAPISSTDARQKPRPSRPCPAPRRRPGQASQSGSRCPRRPRPTHCVGGVTRRSFLAGLAREPRESQGYRCRPSPEAAYGSGPAHSAKVRPPSSRWERPSGPCHAARSFARSSGHWAEDSLGSPVPERPLTPLDRHQVESILFRRRNSASVYV